MAPQAPLRTRSILLAAGIGAGLGAAIAFMLYAVVTNTPAEVSARTYAIYFVIFCAFGAVAGLTLETVRQLQARNPDPAYHRYPRTSPRSSPAPPARQNHERPSPSADASDVD
jgi:hypothetical protein